MPKVFILRTDPYEFADVTSNSYYDWVIHNMYFLFLEQTATGRFAESFRSSPRRRNVRAASRSTTP